MAIVGLYNPACANCASLFGKFFDWARDRSRRDGLPPLALAMVPAAEPNHDLRALQKSLDDPLAVGEFSAHGFGGSPFARDMLISDRDRLVVIGECAGTGTGTIDYRARVTLK